MNCTGDKRGHKLLSNDVLGFSELLDAGIRSEEVRESLGVAFDARIGISQRGTGRRGLNRRNC